MALRPQRCHHCMGVRLSSKPRRPRRQRVRREGYYRSALGTNTNDAHEVMMPSGPVGASGRVGEEIVQMVHTLCVPRRGET